MKRSSRSLAILLSKDLCCFSPQKDHRKKNVSSNGFTRTKLSYSKTIKDISGGMAYGWFMDDLWMAYGWFMDDLWMVMAVGLNSVYQPRKSRLPPSASLTLQPWHDGCEPVGGPGNSRCNPSLVGLPSGNGWHSHESHGPVSSLIYHDLPIFQAVIFNSYVSLPEGILFGIPFQCYGMVWECPLTMNMICSCKNHRPESARGHLRAF